MIFTSVAEVEVLNHVIVFSGLALTPYSIISRPWSNKPYTFNHYPRWMEIGTNLNMDESGKLQSLNKKDTQ